MPHKQLQASHFWPLILPLLPKLPYWYSPSTTHQCSLCGIRACRGCIADSPHFQTPPDRSDTACSLSLWLQPLRLHHREIWTWVWGAGWVGLPRFPDVWPLRAAQQAPTDPVCGKHVRCAVSLFVSAAYQVSLTLLELYNRVPPACLNCVPGFPQIAWAMYQVSLSFFELYDRFPPAWLSCMTGFPQLVSVVYQVSLSLFELYTRFPLIYVCHLASCGLLTNTARDLLQCATDYFHTAGDLTNCRKLRTQAMGVFSLTCALLLK